MALGSRVSSRSPVQQGVAADQQQLGSIDLGCRLAACFGVGLGRVWSAPSLAAERRSVIRISQSFGLTLLSQESQVTCPTGCMDGLESGLFLTEPLSHKEEMQAL